MNVIFFVFFVQKSMYGLGTALGYYVCYICIWFGGYMHTRKDLYIWSDEKENSGGFDQGRRGCLVTGSAADMRRLLVYTSVWGCL